MSIRPLLRRVVDVVVSGIVLVATLPILVVAAMAMRLDSRGPAIHRHVRVGKDGVLFEMYSLRSTVGDACHERPRPEGTSPIVSGSGPGVTRVGRILRWASIDDLPQLWNVLRGDMSLVGPEPTVPVEDAGGSPAGASAPVRVVPGLTGLWGAADSSGLRDGTELHTDVRRNS